MNKWVKAHWGHTRANIPKGVSQEMWNARWESMLGPNYKWFWTQTWSLNSILNFRYKEPMIFSLSEKHNNCFRISNLQKWAAGTDRTNSERKTDGKLFLTAWFKDAQLVVLKTSPALVLKATITKYHKWGGLTHQKFILSQLWRL